MTTRKSMVMVLSMTIATIMQIFMVKIIFFLIIVERNDNTIARIAAQS